MPGGKGKKSVRGANGKILIRCWFFEGENPPGCPTPETCNYVHPSDPEWHRVGSAVVIIRCSHFNQDGEPIGKGCPQGEQCRFLHPTANGWRDAAPADSVTTKLSKQTPSHSKKSNPLRTRPLDRGVGRCRFFDGQGVSIDGGCRHGPACKFVHPAEPEWKKAPRPHPTKPSREKQDDPKRVRCHFLTDKGEPINGGCQAGSACTFLHPGDAGWDKARNVYKTARCENYDDNGNAILGGCPYRSTCTYIHPTDSEWKKSSYRNRREQGTEARANATRGQTRSPSLDRSYYRDGHRSRSPSPDRYRSKQSRRLRSPSPIRRGNFRRSPSPFRGSRRDEPSNWRGDSRELYRRSPSPRFLRRSPSPYYRRPRSRSSPVRYTLRPNSGYHIAGSSRSPTVYSTARYGSGSSRYRDRGRSTSPRPLTRRSTQDTLYNNDEESTPNLQTTISLETGGFVLQNIEDDQYYTNVIEKLAYSEVMLHQAYKGRTTDQPATQQFYKAVISLAKLFPYARSVQDDTNTTDDNENLAHDKACKKTMEISNYMVAVENAIDVYCKNIARRGRDRKLQIAKERALDMEARIKRIRAMLNFDLEFSMQSPTAEASETETVRGDAMDIDVAPTVKLATGGPAPPIVFGAAAASAVVGRSFWNGLKNMFGFGA